MSVLPKVGTDDNAVRSNALAVGFFGDALHDVVDPTSIHFDSEPSKIIVRRTSRA